MRDMFSGMEIREDRYMVDTVEDWSRVRSPSRAARRRRQGHRQNIQFVHVPKPNVFVLFDRVIVGHPVTIAKLVAQAKPLPASLMTGRG